MKAKILKIKKVNLKNNFLIIFRDLKINLSKGEVYFSIFKNSKEKNIKRNEKVTQYFFVIKGQILFEIYDSNFKYKKKFILKENDKNILLLPPKNWYKILPQKNSILFNQVDLNKKLSKKYDQKFKK
mgnify:CR=1 FL=1